MTSSFSMTVGTPPLSFPFLLLRLSSLMLPVFLGLVPGSRPSATGRTLGWKTGPSQMPVNLRTRTRPSSCRRAPQRLPSNRERTLRRRREVSPPVRSVLRSLNIHSKHKIMNPSPSTLSKQTSTGGVNGPVDGLCSTACSSRGF